MIIFGIASVSSLPISSMFENDKYNIRLTYKDSVPDSPQLFYDTGNSFVAQQCVNATVVGERQADFLLNDAIRKNTVSYRIDPISSSENIDLALQSLSIVIDGKEIKTYQGQDFIDIIDSTNGITGIKVQNGYIMLSDITVDPYIVFSKDFTTSIPEESVQYRHAVLLRCILFSIICAVLFVVCLFFLRKPLIRFGDYFEKKLKKIPFLNKSFMLREKLSIPRKLLYFLSVLLFATGVILYSVGQYFLKNFNGLSVEEIIFHLKVPKTGTGNDMIIQYFVSEWKLLVISSCILAGIIIVLRLHKSIRNRHFTNSMAIVLSLAVLIVSIVDVSRDLGLPKYIANLSASSTFIEENYVSPTDITITFPETKRNLIFIYLESMESTFISKEEGGCMPVDLIPELTQLAKDNINFSESDLVGGATSTTGSGWTIAGIVATTTGLPLLIPIDGNSYGEYSSFLPGATSLGEILQDNGYNQEIMVGSDLSFGGRRNYFTQHGDYTVYDLFTARKRPDLPDNYSVWWGYEDTKLYSYAKEEITKLSQNTKPFNFTMLTVDSHHIGGYLCDLCKNEHESQYENVLSCASRQVASFVKWIQSQDFYANTTIVITGDHPTMDNDYITSHYDNSKPRKVYNCFINSAISTTNNKNREFDSFDLFPTILAAMNCELSGDRLGLGTNLFSSSDTLAEIYGYDMINEELSKTSRFYNEKMLSY
ncbi:MAG: sulfatase-like hydrolase/transferase [Lachnospiraceae bacterium]|nr:sulfatase-like hydrolase/transferase [Lachnospiraceae bacterium]